MRKAISITIDETLIETLKENAPKGELSRYIETVLYKGLEFERLLNPKYVVDNTFSYLRELLRLRDNNLIRIKKVNTETKGE